MGVADAETIQAVLTGIYEAALDANLWPRLADRIADMIGAESTHLMAVDRLSGTQVLGLLTRQDPAAHAEYMDVYFPHDVRVPRLERAAPGRILRNRDSWSEEERLASPVYQEYQRGRPSSRSPARSSASRAT